MDIFRDKLRSTRCFGLKIHALDKVMIGWTKEEGWVDAPMNVREAGATRDNKFIGEGCAIASVVGEECSVVFVDSNWFE